MPEVTHPATPPSPSLLIALLSLLRPARWAEHLRRRGWWGPALAFSGALNRRGQSR